MILMSPTTSLISLLLSGRSRCSIWRLEMSLVSFPSSRLFGIGVGVFISGFSGGLCKTNGETVSLCHCFIKLGAHSHIRRRGHGPTSVPLAPMPRHISSCVDYVSLVDGLRSMRWLYSFCHSSAPASFDNVNQCCLRVSFCKLVHEYRAVS
jgi:hypothetical protein